MTAWARLALIGAFLILWIAPTTALFIHTAEIDKNAKQIARNNDTLRESQLRGCHRLNTVRAEDNRSQLKDFEVFSATIALLGKAAEHPTAPMSAQQRREAGAYIAGIQADVLGKEWTPLTQCRPATFHPVSYKPPQPRPFALSANGAPVLKNGKPVLTLPPPSALYLKKGE